MKYRYWIAILWAIIILVLCGMPPQDVDKVKFIDFPHIDKVVHFCLYFVMGVLVVAVLSLNGTLKKSKWLLLVSISICFIYGWIIEIFQQVLFTGRSYEVMDIVADTAGAIVGVLLYRPISRAINK